MIHKTIIALVGTFVVVVMSLLYYYEAAVIGIFGVLGWLAAKKVKTRRKLTFVAVALVGLASTVGINRHVTHDLVVENRSGGVVWLQVFAGTAIDDWQFFVASFSNGRRHVLSVRSLLSAEWQVQVGFPDGSSFNGSTWGLKGNRRRSHPFAERT